MRKIAIHSVSKQYPEPIDIRDRDRDREPNGEREKNQTQTKTEKETLAINGIGYALIKAYQKHWRET